MNESAKRLLELLETVGPRVHILLTKITGRVDAADDLLQELFVKLLRSDGFAKAPNQEAYLIRSAIHLAFDWRKLNRRSAPYEESSQDRDPRAIAPIDALIQSESVRAVLLARWNRYQTMTVIYFACDFWKRNPTRSWQITLKRLCIESVPNAQKLWLVCGELLGSINLSQPN